MTTVEAILNVLGPPENNEVPPKNQLDFVRLVRDGIPYSRLLFAVDNLGISMENAARAGWCCS